MSDTIHKGGNMKLSQAEALALSLNSMLNTKGVAGLKIARNLRMINDELKEYYERKQELFRKYGEEKGDQLVVDKDSENYPLFIKELEPLANEEVEFNFRKLTENDLAESGLTAGQMGLLWDWMVQTDEQ